MRKTILLPLFGVLFAPALASAQATVGGTMELRLGLPIVLPQLVVVSPGVQVVPDMDEEVFFSDGYYWARHDHGWYRSHNHRGGWVLVPGRAVPARLAGLPPGKYRRWKGHAAPAAYRGGPGPDHRGAFGPGEHRGGGFGPGDHRGGGFGPGERRGGGDDGWKGDKKGKKHGKHD